METLSTLHLNPANEQHIKTYGEMDQDDLEKINYTIYLIEKSRDSDRPIFGDRIICTTPNNIVYPKHPNGHLNFPIEKEYASICVQPTSAPFVFHNGTEIIKYSCSGGYWTAEQELDMFCYNREVKKVFCQWGKNGACKYGAIYFHAYVNEWLLVRENLN